MLEKLQDWLETIEFGPPQQSFLYLLFFIVGFCIAYYIGKSAGVFVREAIVGFFLSAFK